ncbi:hypothetical protein LTS07_006736 [Exophiala sideris]|uniref:Xylanolytic transcriptional activator regulatory domain-containing protein n=1 Tax=Exophiala sideris TaxID=1016849 RepID=A0ABR0J9U4_9EURO|nr:hypothetical protein LTS07_006736 [Exophiala sideris]KAK5037549.1 hypothetical protein LTR13_004707 [Exophiala sideris]KAK5059210.1 hypothetical protein LTR69_006500 [Exophiala sideris]KAK5183045.1 hypothetical protein LTR44_004756 [Eurotiomycetes sp. CCFEE 6388]
MARHVSNRFNEICPENSLAPDHFSILSKLFREAIGGEGPPANLDHEGSVLESPSSRLTGSAVDGDALPSQNGFLVLVSETIPSEDVPRRETHVSSDETCFHANVLAIQEDSTLLNVVMANLPPYKQAESLTDIFFTYLESNWYYFDERWFRNLLAQLYNGMSPTLQPQCTSVCLVFLVLALGASFMHLKQPNAVHSPDHGAAWGELPGSNFYRFAIGLMPSVLAARSVESVQCCLLTALYILPTQNVSHFFTYLGLALRLAISLSLHLKGPDLQISPQAREVRARVFWTAYCIDRQTCIVMGLPAMLQVKDISAPLPQRQRELDELQPLKIDRLTAFTKLTLVMDKVTSSSPVEETREKFSWACSILEDWKRSLPTHLVALDDASLRANAHLDIMYEMTWIYIGRAALLRLVRKRLHKTAEVSEFDRSTNPRGQELSERCAKAGYTIIVWINLLRSRKKLAKFSYTDFHSCSSAIIILLLNDVLHPQNSYSSLIENGIDALRFMAGGSQLAKDALHLVERLHEGIRKFNRPHERSTQELGGSTSQDHYDNAAEVPSSSAEDATEYTASDFENFDAALFSDLEPSLLQYSNQDLSLFGFDGFYPTVEGTNESLWNWATPENPVLDWHTDPGHVGL